MPLKETITNEEVNLLPNVSFDREIVVVSDAAGADAACADLERCPLIGFDTETRPSFAKGVSNKVALLQLSTAERVYLFRLNCMPLEKPIARLLESKSVLKIGAAVRDDIGGLRALRQFTPGGFVDLQKIVGDYGIKELSLKKMAAIVMGVRISKAQRLSNWEAKVLTPAQQAYAATDAWISREIYVRLVKP